MFHSMASCRVRAALKRTQAVDSILADGPPGTPVKSRGLRGTLAKPYDLLLGRKTYEIFASYWPDVPADNRIGPVFTKANKYDSSEKSVGKLRFRELPK
jgi:hypothetical protein